MIWNLLACVGGASVEIVDTAKTGVDSEESTEETADTGETGATETGDTATTETDTVDTSLADPFADYGSGDGPNPVTEADEKIDGQDVTWYTPAGVDPVGLLIWSHGFGRAKEQHASAARRAASWGFLVVTPNLPNFSDHEANGEWLATTLLPTALAASGLDAAHTAFVGHSAGGLASLVAAAQSEVGAYVGLDPVDASDLGLSVMGSVTEPALLLHGDPSSCNSDGNSAAWTTAGPSWAPSVTTANHCDFESDSDWLCETFCGTADPARQEVIQAYAVAWAAHYLVGGADDWVPGGAQVAADESAGIISE